MKMNIRLGVLLSVLLVANLSMGAVTLSRETTLTDRALYFTEGYFSRLISIHGNCLDVVNDYIYVVWYEGGMSNRVLHLSRKPVGGTTWVDMNLGVFNTLYPASDVERAGMGDSHRTAAIGICPIDQTIHISFDQHGGNLRYLRSNPGAAIVPDAQWTTNLMNPEQKYLVPGSNLTITYPGFARNDDGGLIFGYRIGGSARGDRYASYYNGSVWSASKLLVKGQSSVAANDFHFYSGISYQHGKPYISGAVRAYSVGYNRGCYFGIFSSQNSLSSHFLRLDGSAIPIPIDTKTEMDFLKVADPSVAANDHVGVFGCAVTARGDVYLSNGEQTYLQRYDESAFSLINNTRGDLHGLGNTIFACSHNNGSVSTYRDKIYRAANGSGSWTEEYAGPQRGYLNSVSVAYKNKIIGMFLDDGPGTDEKTVYCREYDTGEPVPQYPFRGDRQFIPGTVEAEHFDMGGQNVSYYDATPVRGGDPAFRPLETVDCTATNVGGIDAGEWLEYGVEVTNAGSCHISLKTSCVSNGRTARVAFDGATLAQFAIPNTTDFNIFQTVTVSNVPLNQGNFILRLSTDTGGFNLDSIKFEPAVVPPAAPVVSVTNNTPGALVWTCPPGVTHVQVECWGGGGAGGAASKSATNNATGGGGGGGAYARKASVPVTPGTNYLIVIPAAATAPVGSATDLQRFNGSDVTFTGDNGVVVTAAGGQGGQTRISTDAGNVTGLGGVGGTANDCVGDVGGVFAGGNGGNAGASPSGGGGGGAGNANSGGSGVDGAITAGVGGASSGGNGGAGRTGAGNGNPGSPAGGGGAGAKAQNAGSSKDGGIGGLGQIVLTYHQVPAERPVLGHYQSGGSLVLSWLGGGFKTQVCTNLAQGIWSDVPGGSVSPVNITPAQPEAFYRLIGQ